jgi:hypothetical protein
MLIRSAFEDGRWCGRSDVVGSKQLAEIDSTEQVECRLHASLLCFPGDLAGKTAPAAAFIATRSLWSISRWTSVLVSFQAAMKAGCRGSQREMVTR